MFTRLITLLLLLWVTTSASAQTFNLSGTLSGDQENPPTGSPATGNLSGTIDAATGNISITVSYSNLNGTLSAAHIHLAPEGKNGGVILNLAPPTGQTSGTFSHSGTLSADQTIALIAEGCYVNLHSSTNGGGEIRGQVRNADADFTGFLTNDKAQPPGGTPVPSEVTGSVVALYDGSTMTLNVYAAYADAISEPTAAHIHDGDATQNGGVVFGLSPGLTNGAADGVYSGSNTNPLTAGQEADLMANGLYINIHTSENTGGEARSQLEAVGALALDLSDFRVRMERNDAILTWQVGPSNAQRFELEMAKREAEFRRVATLAARTQAAQQYEHRIPDLAAGDYYFRLRTWTMDGRNSVSPVLRLRIQRDMRSPLQVVQNPVERGLRLQATEDLPAGTVVQLLDANGRLLVSESTPILAIGSLWQPERLRTDLLPVGTYYLRVEGTTLPLLVGQF